MLQRELDDIADKKGYVTLEDLENYVKEFAKTNENYKELLKFIKFVKQEMNKTK